MAGRHHNIGGKGDSNVQTSGTWNRSHALGLKAQKVRTHMRKKIRRKH